MCVFHESVGAKCSGEEMDATILRTLGCNPRTFACQGYPACGDDADQGPKWGPQNFCTPIPVFVPKRGPKYGPRLGAVLLCTVRKWGAKTEPILACFWSPSAIAVWQCLRFLLRQVPAGRPILRLNLDETSIGFKYAPLRRPTSQVPRAGCAGSGV